jgi:cytochrome c-type biogenesis protein
MKINDLLHNMTSKNVCMFSLLLLIFNLSIQNNASSQKNTDFPLAPTYSSTDLDTKKMITLESIYTKNNLTLLNLWATWCQLCRAEIPILNNVYQDLSKYGVDIVGVSIDRRGSKPMVKSFTNNLNMTYPILFDPNNNFARVFKAIGVPESSLINSDGQVVHRWRGPIEGNPVNIEKFVADQSPSISTKLNSISGIQSTNNPSASTGPMATKTIHSSSSSTPQTILSYNIGIPLAFIGGLLSFLSPCVFPLIPSFLAFVT